MLLQLSGLGKDAGTTGVTQDDAQVLQNVPNNGLALSDVGLVLAAPHLLRHLVDQSAKGKPAVVAGLRLAQRLEGEGVSIWFQSRPIRKEKGEKKDQGLMHVFEDSVAVSYTHLTLPTKLIV